MIGEIGENIVITEDHLDGFSLDEETVEQYIEDDFNERFRVYDDDDILYYDGLMYGDGYDDDPFEPLDWAREDSGCTRIDYYNGPVGEDFKEEYLDDNTNWETL